MANGGRTGPIGRWEALRAAGRRFLRSSLVLGLLASSPVFPAEEEWRLFAQVQEDRADINLASIERADTLFFVEYRLVLANATDARFGQGSVSEIRKRLALSCGQPQVAVIEVRELDAEGKQIGRGGVPREQWKFFEPAAGGMEWKVRQLVCRTFAERARKTGGAAPSERPAAGSGATGELMLRPAATLDTNKVLPE